MRIGSSFLLAIAALTLSCGGAAPDAGAGGAGGASTSSSSSSSSSSSTSSSSSSGVASSTSSSSSSGATNSSTSSSGSSGGGGAGGAAGCGIYAGNAQFHCAPDGNGRGKCSGGALAFEDCARGCLIEPVGQDDVCMGLTNTWSCGGSYGKVKVEDGDYYATEFGCWTDSNNAIHTDPGDNCIPSCLSKAQASGLCPGMSGPACEEKVDWYAADGARFGCLARLRVTNPKNGKACVVVALDYGPSCSVENSVSHAIIDLSGPANLHLFGSAQGAVDKALVHVVEVDPTTPLGAL